MRGKFLLIIGVILPLLFAVAWACVDTVLYPYSPVNYLIPSNEEMYQPATPTTSVDLTKIPYVDKNGLFYTFRYEALGLFIPSPFVPYPDSTTECFQIYYVNPDKLPSSAVFMYWNVTNGYDGALVELYTYNVTEDSLTLDSRACVYDLAYAGTRCPNLLGLSQSIWFGCSGSKCYLDLNKYTEPNFLKNNIQAGRPVAVRICAQRYGGVGKLPSWSCINGDYYQVIDVLFAPAKRCDATLSGIIDCGNSEDGTGYVGFTIGTGCEQDNPDADYFIQQPTNVSYTLECYDHNGDLVLTKTEEGIITYIDTQYWKVSRGGTVSKDLAYCNLSVTAVPFYGDSASTEFSATCSEATSSQNEGSTDQNGTSGQNGTSNGLGNESVTDLGNTSISLIRPLYPVLYLCGQNYIVRRDLSTLDYRIDIRKVNDSVSYGIDVDSLQVCVNGDCDQVSPIPYTCDPNYTPGFPPCYGDCANCNGTVIGGYPWNPLDGNYTIYMKVNDTEGNQSTTKTYTYWIDSTPPSVSITAPSSGYEVNVPSVGVSFTASDSGTGIKYYMVEVKDLVTGQKKYFSNGLSYLLTNVDRPNCPASVGGTSAPTCTTDYDCASYCSGATTCILPGGRTGTVVPSCDNGECTCLCSATGTPTYQSTTPITGLATLTATAPVTTSSVSYNTVLTVPILNVSCDDQRITVTVCDYAGNCGSDSVIVRYVTPDTTPPEIALEPLTPFKVISGINWTISSDSSMDLNWTAGDVYGIRNVTSCIDGNCTTEYYAPSCDVCSSLCGFVVTGTKTLSAGKHTVTLIAEDAYGNTATYTRRYMIDPYPPTVSINSPKEGTIVGSPIEITWSATDLVSGIEKQQILVYNTSDSTHPLIYNTTLFASARSTTISLPTGYYNITVVVKAWDYAGNVGEDSVDLVFDGIPPTVQIISPENRANVTEPYQLVYWVSSDVGSGIESQTIDSLSETGFVWTRKLPSDANSSYVRIDNSSYIYTNITVVACDYAGNCGSDSISVRFSALPVPVISLDTYTDSKTGDFVLELDGTQSYDPDGGIITKYIWTYEYPGRSGKFNKTSSRRSFSDSFQPLPGLYSVWLTVYDDENQSATTYDTYTVCSDQSCIDPAIVSTDILLEKDVLFEGNNQTATITVHNLGSALTQPLKVEVYDSGKLINTTIINGLAACGDPGSDYTFTVTWAVDYIGEANHTLVVKLDPDNAINECNENNNQAETTFYVYRGSSCYIGSDKDEIAYTGCPDYWASVCDGLNPQVRPSCCRDNSCAKLYCDMNAQISGYIANPDFPIVDGNVGWDLGTLLWEWTLQNDNNWEMEGTFSSSETGVATLRIYGQTADGAYCSASTEVKVTKTGHEFDWPDVALENLEVVPKPLTNLPSEICVTVKNLGPKETGNFDIVWFPAKKVDFQLLRERLRTENLAVLESEGLISKTTVSLAPGEEKRICPWTWVPKETGVYTLYAGAQIVDSNMENNEITKQETVEVGREVAEIAVPEYPGYLPIVAIALVAILAYFISRRE